MNQDVVAEEAIRQDILQRSMISQEMLNDSIDIYAMFICSDFDSEQMRIRSPQESRALWQTGQPINNYILSVWEQHVNLYQKGVKFIFYEDEYLKILFGFTATKAGGIAKEVVAVQLRDQIMDDDRLVFLWKKDAPDETVLIETVESWQDKMMQTSYSISHLKRQFYLSEEAS